VAPLLCNFPADLLAFGVPGLPFVALWALLFPGLSGDLIRDLGGVRLDRARMCDGHDGSFLCSAGDLRQPVGLGLLTLCEPRLKR
jgi:hypothetical protein